MTAMAEADVHIHAVVAETEQIEVLGRINLSGGAITSLEKAGDRRTAISQKCPERTLTDSKFGFRITRKNQVRLKKGLSEWQPIDSPRDARHDRSLLS